MGFKPVGAFLVALGLLLLVAAGGVAGETQSIDGIDVQDSGTVTIDDALHNVDGETDVIVELRGSEATTQNQLQAHASKTQQALVAFAESKTGVTVENQFWITNAVLLTVNTDRVPLSDVARIEGVEAVHENAEFTLDRGVSEGSPVLGAASDDVAAANSYTYGLEQINAPTAWGNYGTQGEGASVAVLDTGVDADHPDLSVAKWQEFDSDGNPVDSQPNDGQGHGTHVSGTATGSANPAGDVPAFGVAPNADLYGVKVLDDSGGGSFAQIIAGMQWAVQEDADIISMSLGATGFYDQMIDPVRNAHDAGTVVITSAGNSGDGSSGSPGNVYDSIAVGASNSNQGIAGFSSGEVVDTASDWSSAPDDWPSEYTVPTIAAPGVDTLSSVPGGGYDDTYSGTSMAAPHVSGAVALAESATNRSLAPSEIEEALEATAFKPSDAPSPPGERDTRYGSGIIDADALTGYLQNIENESLLTLTASGPDSIDPGQTLDIDYTIENIGGAEGSESGINLLIDGAVEDSNGGVTLAPGETASGTLSFADTAQYDGEMIEWTVELQDAGKTVSGQTGVGAEPGSNITIQSIDYPSSIAPSDSLSVDYTLENTGLEDGTESFVDLIIDGTDNSFDDTDSDVTVPGGGTTSGTLTFDNVSGYFSDGDTIDFSVELWDFGDVAEGSVDVGSGEDPPGESDIVIQSINAPSSIAPDENLSVSYTLENLGDADGTESFVDLLVNGTDSTYDDTDSGVSVPAGGTTSGTLTFDNVSGYFSDGDTIDFSVELWDAGDVAEGSTDVSEGGSGEPDIVIQSIDAPSSIAPDEDLNVGYTLENLGGADGQESFVDLKVNGTDSGFDDTDFNVNVSAGGTTSGTLTFDNVSGYFSDGDTIDFSVELWDFGDVAEGSTDVSSGEDPPGEADIVIQSIDYDSTVQIGGALSVDYTLENVGGADGQESFVDLIIDGTDNAFDDTDFDVNVSAGGTTSGTLSFDAIGDYYEPGDTISFSVELWDFGDVAEGQATYEVPDEPILQLASVDAPTVIEAGEDLTVDYTIENIGGAEGTESAVDLLVDGELGDTDADVTVPAQDSVSGSLTFEDVSVSEALERLNSPDDSSTTEDRGLQISDGVRTASGPTEVIVEFSDAPGASSTDDLQAHASEAQKRLTAFAAATDGLTVESQFWLSPMALVEVNLDRVSVADLARVENVEAVYENARFTADTGSGSGAVLADQVSANDYTYGLEQINAPTAWNTHNTTGEGASVAVLDTGVDADHPDLSVAKWQEFDSDGNPVDSQPNDGQGHGTHVSGTATGSANPAGDVPAFGVAPNADLYGVKVLDDSGGGSFAQIIAGMQWAVQEDADIISMSLGATGFYDQMIDPVRNAHDAGTVVITSAGNSGDGSSGSPGNVYDSIAVGASNSNQGIAGFSSGEVVDTASDWSSAPDDWPSEYTVPTIAAPGVDTLSSVPGGGYDDTYSGTSMAAPHVSGAVALALSATEEDVTPSMIEDALEMTAFKPADAPSPPGERDTRYGSGIIDADALTTYLKDPPEGETVSYTVALADTGDSQTGEVFVENASEEPPGEGEFAIANVSANVPVEGEELEVLVDVENIGNSSTTETVDVTIDGLGSDATNVTLGAGESTEAMLTVGTAAGDAGQYDAVVTTASDQTTEPILVVAPSEFQVDILSATESVEEGQDIEVTAAIENVGDVDDTQTVTLDIPGLGSDSAEVTLPFDESTEETFAVSTGAGDAGQYNATVASEDDEDSVAVEVTGNTDFQIVSVEVPTVIEGESLDVTATIENVGDEGGTSTVSASIEGVGENSTAVTIGAGESTDVTLALDTDIGDAGEYTVVIETPQDSVSVTATLNLPTLPNQDAPPTDTDGDNLYEDADGNGVFDIFDVLVFFNTHDAPMMDEHGWAFDFNNDGEVDVFDVQAQFAKLADS
jgi:subtilisin family serine protease